MARSLMTKKGVYEYITLVPPLHDQYTKIVRQSQGIN